MMAAAHVTVHYLLILLLPSVIAVVMVGLTWYYRAKARGDADAKPGRPSDEKHGDPPAPKSGRSSAAKSSRSTGAKRRRK